MKKETLIVIPAYNEADKIGRVIEQIKEISSEIDILVIDDGSSDDTAVAAKKGGAKVVSLPINLGYGSALETGYKYAYNNDYNYIVQIDADGQHEPKCINDLLDVLKNNEADIVIGSRFLGKNDYKAPAIRKMGMVIFAKLTSLLTGKKFTDSTSGFQAMNKKVIKFFVNGFYPSDYPDADVLILLNKSGFRILEIPVIMYSNEKNKKSMHSGIFKPLYYNFKMFLSISMIYLRKR
ncbi:MAG: glycosyltransferase family 2 protein [Candidatus Parcubacteria bacterium]|nr:glycosyltransferase family 2 protein [Candidatus Parcubacteria bacterium]